jgi:3-mercaptopyruvate sulfurtransferase SseA
MHPFLLAALLAASPGESMLVSPEWLAAHRTDRGLVILHVSMGRTEYDREHVSGARWVDPHSLIQNGPPGTELPSIATIDSVLEALGVTDQSRIVYYGDTWMAPRLFLALEYAGLGEQVALLDGGLPAYRAAKASCPMRLPPGPAARSPPGPIPRSWCRPSGSRRT